MLIRFIYLKVGDVLVDRLNKMIMKAERICGTEQMCAGFIDPSEREPGKWDAVGHIWNGIPGSGTKQERFSCNTLEDAKRVLQELNDKYPCDKDVVIFINDLI